jgi:hypothetical protein
MATLIETPVTVPSSDESPVKVVPGDPWPLPYRGSKYSVSKQGNGLKMSWNRMDFVHYADAIPKELISSMIQHKRDSRGSFRITPHREVITKLIDDDYSSTPLYLGKLEGDFNFIGFDLNPKELEIGSIWPGLNFKHGEEFAVWNREGNNDYLYWEKKGIKFRSIEKYPELCTVVRDIRPRAGRIYFTEFGHIWMNLEINGASPKWSNVIGSKLKKDLDMLKNNDILLRAIKLRIDETGTMPIYLGKIQDFDSGLPPRTHFSFGAIFGKGSEDEGDE